MEEAQQIASDSTRAGRSSRLQTYAAVVFSYAALVCLFSWPLPLHLMDQVVLARGSDFYPHVWNLWWMRFSLLTLHQQPYYTTYLQYPSGLPLLYHVLDPLNGLVSIPLQFALGLVPAYNLLRLAHMIFAASAACALCRVLRLPWQAAWVGGALFAFCPLVGTSMDLGQLVELSVGWLPLYILLLIKALGNRALGIQSGGKVYLVGAGLALAASALSTWYFFTSLVLFTLIYVAWEIGALLLSARRTSPPHPGTDTAVATTTRELRSASFRLIYRAAIVGITALLILSPLIIALLRENASGATYMVTPFRTVVLNSADLFALFLPFPAHITDPVINPHGSNPAVGWTVLALALVGLVFAAQKARHTKGENESRAHSLLRFWFVVAVVFALLALGPELVVGGQDTGIPMPYQMLNSLPFLGAARVPLRFVLMVSLALAVLAAHGVLWLSSWVRAPIARVALFGTLALFATVEFFDIPRSLIMPDTHPFVAALKVDGSGAGREAVLELPYDERAAPAMFDQTIHQRPILGGYTARHYPYSWILTTPGIAELTLLDQMEFEATDIITPSLRNSVLPALDYYGVRYVAYYAAGKEKSDRIDAVIEAIFTRNGVNPIYKDAMLTAYRVPSQPQTQPLAWLGEGWYKLEKRDDLAWRWTDGQAQVQVVNPTSIVRKSRLSLSAYALSTPRTLIVLLDEREVGRQQIAPFPGSALNLDLSLSPGDHSLELRSLEPPEKVPGDNRDLALGFQRVALDFP